MPMLRRAVALRIRFQNGMVVAWYGHGRACVNQTGPHCVNQMGKTKSKPLAVRFGRGMPWARHGHSKYNGMTVVDTPDGDDIYRNVTAFNNKKNIILTVVIRIVASF
jgi:hypothetical protein